MSHHISGFVADRDKLKEAVKGYEEAHVIVLNANNLGFLPWTWELDAKMKKSFFHKFDFPVAFIETDYFGGFGEQNARMKKGREVLLPRGEINEALRLFGVKRGESDEFDEVGFGRWRSNDDWVDYGARA